VTESKKRLMTEAHARRIARERNAERQPGDPVWAVNCTDAWDQERRNFEAGPVTFNLPPADLMQRDFEEL
jgi:hypothetical protein